MHRQRIYIIYPRYEVYPSFWSGIFLDRVYRAAETMQVLIDRFVGTHSRQKRELAALAPICMHPTILSFRSSLVAFLPQQQQQTIVNLHHNSRFASQILYRLKKAQIPQFQSLEICGVDSTPLKRLAPSHVHFLLQLLLHDSPSQPTSHTFIAKALIKVIIPAVESTEILQYIDSTTQQNLPNDIKRPSQNHWRRSISSSTKVNHPFQL